MKVIALIELVFGSGSTVFLYFVLRVYMWRTYYQHNHMTPHAGGIDRGDKILATLFALLLGIFWVASIPVYLLWRHHVAKQKRVAAGLYADRMMHRFGPAYVEEYDEHRRG